MSRHNTPKNLWLALLALLTLAVPATAQISLTDSQTKSDVPVVTINQVSFEPTLTSANVTWSVQTVPSTKLLRFEVFFEAILSDNSKRGGSITAFGSARQATVTIAGTPNLKPILSTKTTIKTVYTIPSVLTAKRTVNFLNNYTTEMDPSSPFNVTQLNQVTSGCSTGQDCFDLKWSASLSATITSYNGFNFDFRAIYGDGPGSGGLSSSVQASASGSERQKRVAVTKQSGSLEFLIAEITANVTLTQEISVTKQTP